MKIKIIIEADTDTELLEGVISSYNRIYTEMNESAKNGNYSKDAVLHKMSRGCRHTKTGSIPTYDIGVDNG